MNTMTAMNAMNTIKMSGLLLGAALACCSMLVGCGDETGDSGTSGTTSSSSSGGGGSGGGGPGLATAGNLPHSLAVDATHLYWIEDTTGIVARVPKAGGAREEVSGGDPSSKWLNVDDSSVYWNTSTANTVMKAPKAGGKADVLVNIMLSANGGHHLTQDATHLYWGEMGEIIRVPKAGGNYEVAWSGSGSVGDLAVDDKNVYFGNGFFVYFAPLGMMLPMEMGLGSGELEAAKTVVLMGDTVILACGLTSMKTTVVRTIPKPPAMGMFTELGQIEGDPIEMAADAQNVYCATTKGIYKVAAAGGTPELVVDSAVVSGFAADDKNLYWGDSETKALMSAAK